MKKQLKKLHNQKGFTLLEILVVISIVAFITNFLLYTFASGRRKARDSVRVQTARNMIYALADIDINDGKLPCHDYQTSAEANFMSFLVTKGYLTKKPTDPLQKNGFYYDFFTLKNTPVGQCGSIAAISFNLEDPSLCPLGGVTYSYGHSHGNGASIHCHLFYPTPPPSPCETQYYIDNPLACSALIDESSENDY